MKSFFFRRITSPTWTSFHLAVLNLEIKNCNDWESVGRHFLEASNSGETCHRVGIAKRWGVQPLCAAGQSQADHPRDLPEWDRWFKRGPCGTVPCICLSLGCPLFLFSFLSVPCHLFHAGPTQEHELSGSGVLGSISECWSLSFISKSGYEWGLYALFWPFQ